MIALGNWRSDPPQIIIIKCLEMKIGKSKMKNGNWSNEKMKPTVIIIKLWASSRLYRLNWNHFTCVGCLFIIFHANKTIIRYKFHLNYYFDQKVRNLWVKLFKKNNNRWRISHLIHYFFELPPFAVFFQQFSR